MSERFIIEPTAEELVSVSDVACRGLKESDVDALSLLSGFEEHPENFLSLAQEPNHFGIVATGRCLAAGKVRRILGAAIAERVPVEETQFPRAERRPDFGPFENVITIPDTGDDRMKVLSINVLAVHKDVDRRYAVVKPLLLQLQQIAESERYRGLETRTLDSDAQALQLLQELDFALTGKIRGRRKQIKYILSWAARYDRTFRMPTRHFDSCSASPSSPSEE